MIINTTLMYKSHYFISELISKILCESSEFNRFGRKSTTQMGIIKKNSRKFQMGKKEGAIFFMI